MPSGMVIKSQHMPAARHFQACMASNCAVQVTVQAKAL